MQLKFDCQLACARRLADFYKSRYVVLSEKSDPAQNFADFVIRGNESLNLSNLSKKQEMERPFISEAEEKIFASKRDAKFFSPAQFAKDIDTAPVDALANCLATAKDPNLYRPYLIQASIDLLAEASASAFGCIGVGGKIQTDLFRILVDEFGGGNYFEKHSYLYERVLEYFGLSFEYWGYNKYFFLQTFDFHNFIHFIFQNPRYFFFQIGFLMNAETGYRKSTSEQFLALNSLGVPSESIKYLSEHAHIDIYHSKIINEEVFKQVAADFGEGATTEVVAGIRFSQNYIGRFNDSVIGYTKFIDSSAAKFVNDQDFNVSASPVAFDQVDVRRSYLSCGHYLVDGALIKQSNLYGVPFFEVLDV